MYLLLLVAITLGSGFVIHGALSLGSALIWQVSRKRIEQVSPQRSSQYLFTLRIAPSVLTLILAALFVVPAFLRFEPRTTGEPVPLSLALLAAIALTVLVGAFSRSATALLQSNRVMRSWMKGAVEQPSTLNGVRVYRCKLDFPVIAVLGVWRTRIFVSDGLYAVLTTEELEAALRHEIVHVNSRDTLKKLLLHAAPKIFPAIDVLGSIRESWARVCELSADEQAVCHGEHSTHSLASALVKVARVSHPMEMPTLSAALTNDPENFLGYRVERLLQISTANTNNSSDRNVLAHPMSVCCGLLMLGLLAYPQALSLTHELLEFFVRGW